MAFANECGFKKILVLSGLTLKNKLKSNHDLSTRPDYYADSVYDIYKVLQSINRSSL